jgi:cytochrome c oxidase assembly factor CtaG
MLMALAGFIALAIVLAALGGSGLFPTGHNGPSARTTTDLMRLWSVPPVEVSAIVIASALYAVRVRRVGGVSGGRQASFAAGIALLLAAICSPLGGVAQQGLLTAHMLQHTLIGAVAPLLLLVGMPRGFVAGMIGPRTREALIRLQHPAIAYPLWALTTIAWLLPVIHHRVLDDQPLWIAQQLSFLVFGTLLWAPVVEVLPAPRWFGSGLKSLYMVGVWFLGLGIANVYWFSGTAFYAQHAEAARAWGIAPLEDQANAGTTMMVLHCLLAFGAITVLFFRHAREGELRQRLLEAGIDPVRVAEATRDGTGRELARAYGLPERTRAGID